MAGDWLKFDKDTPDKPEVFEIATELQIDPDAVVGKLMRVWSWFDSHTEDGNALRVTPALLDRCAGHVGFVSAMERVGWMVVADGGCALPKFDRHCGKTAKSRALGAKRSADFRGRNGDGVTNALPREEKRREEKNKIKRTSPSARRAAGGEDPEGFAEFWTAYPRPDGRKAAVKAWASLAPNGDLQAVILEAVKRQAKSDKWRENGGQYVPHGSTWLNGERWTDGQKSGNVVAHPTMGIDNALADYIAGAI
jgi:hypothetical protein